MAFGIYGLARVVIGSYANRLEKSRTHRIQLLSPEKVGGRGGGEIGDFGQIRLGLNEYDAAIKRQRLEKHGEPGAFIMREGHTDAAPDRLLAQRGGP